VAQSLKAAREAFLSVVDFMVAHGKSDPNAAYAGSVPYLMLTGNLVAGWQMARALLVAQSLLTKGEDEAFMQAKITTARFYADHLLSKAPGVAASITHGAASVTAMALDAF
jgi:cytochrome c-type biogenesis protein CcmE